MTDKNNKKKTKRKENRSYPLGQSEKDPKEVQRIESEKDSTKKGENDG